jgi:putative transposase
MKRSKFTEKQILFALKQADSGQPVGDVCRQMGISEATFYVWKKRYGDLGLLEVRELRQLRDENARLKRLAAVLTLDRHVLQEVVKKRSDGLSTKRHRPMDPGLLQVERTAFLQTDRPARCDVALPLAGSRCECAAPAPTGAGDRPASVRLRA